MLYGPDRNRRRWYLHGRVVVQVPLAPGASNFQFLASYTWSHTIDDSTDLQSPLAPQDSYFPSARS